MDDVVVFRYAVDAEGRAAGGRVLSVTGFGATVAEARSTAYDAVGRISWPGMYVRTDIASSEGA